MSRASAMPDRCRRCDRAVVPTSEWVHLTREQRREHKRNRVRQYRARGLCVACWQYARTHGEVERYARTNDRRGEAFADSAWHLCARCGAGNRRADGLCLDCADVAHDLNELDRWVQPTPV